jgi:chromosome segregation ATPase
MAQPNHAAQPFADQLSRIARASALLKETAQRLHQAEDALQAVHGENEHLRDQLQDALDRAQIAETLLEDAERRSRELENSLAATQADLSAVTEAIEASLPDLTAATPRSHPVYGR